MRVRTLAALPVIAALLAIAPAVAVHHSAAASDGAGWSSVEPVSNEAGRRSGAKASSFR
jgi:hypothetical protein